MTISANRLGKDFLSSCGVAVMLGCLAFPLPSWSNPSGATVRHGDIQIQAAGNTLQIIQGTNQGIVDWNSFSIQQGQTTRFVQPNSQSATLNRVTGGAVSRIDGNLQANGHIFLLNPNGVVIGRNGMIDVAGFTASTLDLRNEDFLNGGDLQFQGSSQAAILNLGTVSAFDGDVFLVAASVINSGRILAPNGTVGLAAGNDVLIKESGSERVFVRGANGAKKENGVINKGTVEANVAELKSYGGNIYGMAVKNEGRVAATGVSREGGQIFLRSGGSRSSGSRIKSTGTLVGKKPTESSGGTVVVDAGEGGAAEVGGTVDASGEQGTGGTVLILGQMIDIFEGSLFLADGDAGGGAIRIGGGRRGQDPLLMNATDVTVGNGARLDASARVSGDGGEIISFAERSLVFEGRAEVRGGSQGGDGGFVELSGKETVRLPTLSEAVDVSAAQGVNGTLLLDPNDIWIKADTRTASLLGDGEATVISPNEIFDWEVRDFLQTMGSLVIATDASGSGGVGNITVENGAWITWDSNSDLTFHAAAMFIMEDNTRIERTYDFDPMGAQLGSVKIHGVEGVMLGLNAPDIEIYTPGPWISVADGDIEISNSPTATNRSGVSLLNSQVVSLTGNISIDGYAATAGRSGVSVTDSAVASESGAIKLNGVAMDGHGVEVAKAEIQTSGLEVTIRGEALGASGARSGVLLDGTDGEFFGDGVGFSIDVGDGGLLKIAGRGSGANGQAIQVTNPESAYMPFFITGTNVELESLGGDVEVEGIWTESLTFSDPDGLAQHAEVRNSFVEVFSAVNVGSVNVDVGYSLEIGAIALASDASFSTYEIDAESLGLEDFDVIGGGRSGIVANGVIQAGQSILFDVSANPSARVEVVQALQSPSIAFRGGVLRGGASQNDVETHGSFALEGVTFTGIDEVKGVGSSGNSLIDSSRNSTISLTTDYEDLGAASDSEIEGTSLPYLGDPSTVVKIDGIDGVRFRGYDTVAGGAGDDTFEVMLDSVDNFNGTLSGGRGDDTFVMHEGGSVGEIDGGINSDTIDYSSFTTSVTADFGTNSGTQVESIMRLENVIGGDAEDSLLGTSHADVFRVKSDNSGNLNNGTFSNFELLRGRGGNDQFIFTNQATVTKVFGGGGFDSLRIDDRNLQGTNTYTIGSNSITRNPTYLFSSLESLQLLLGAGNDTVVTQGNGVVQLLNGGGGYDALHIGNRQFLPASPFVIGGSTFIVSGFESPASASNSNAGRPQTLLTLQTQNVPRRGPNQQNNGAPIDQFSNSGPGPSNPLVGPGGSNPGGNAFGAIAAIAGQAAVIQVDGGRFALQAPASLDGLFSVPPVVVIKNLTQNLEPDAFSELAGAIDFEGSTILVMSDGSYSIDLSGVPPNELMAMLEANLLVDTAQELSEALELTLALPITSIDGAVGIVPIPVVIDPQTLALLNQMLADNALGELTGALDGE